MKKREYYVAHFPNSPVKDHFAKFSRDMLDAIDYFFENLPQYTDESYGESPRKLLHNLMQNNENMFFRENFSSSSYGSSSCVKLFSSGSLSQAIGASSQKSPHQASMESNEEPSKKTIVDLSEESPSQVIVESNSSSISQKYLPCRLTNSSLVTSNIENELAVPKSQVSIISSKKPKESIRKSKTLKTSMHNWKKFEETEKRIKYLIKSNLLQIRSISVIKKMDNIGVEIGMDEISVRKSHRKNLKENSSVKLDPSNRKIVISSDKVIKKSPSPKIDLSKNRLSRIPSISSKSIMADSSNRPRLEFIADRLLKILRYRKKYMKKIYVYFLKFQSDARKFKNNVRDIKFMVKHLYKAEGKYFTGDFAEMRRNMTIEANEILQKVLTMVQELDKEVDVWKECFNQIDNFDTTYGRALSEKKEEVLNDVVLRNLDSMLRSICCKADSTLILKDGRKEVLLQSLTNFECLVKNFVKFLIVMEILKPALIFDELKE